MAFGKLTVNELTKHLWRVDKFLDRANNGKPFIENDTGREVVVDRYGKESQQALVQLQVFKNSGGKSNVNSYLKLNVTYKDTGEKAVLALGKLRKDVDLGGGGGVAGGSYQTKYVESGQCLINALLQEVKGFSEEGLNAFNIPWSNSWNNLKCSFGKDLNPKKIWDKIITLDPEWKTTLLKTGQHLVNTSKGGYWHWQDSFVKSIEDLYNSYEDKLPGKIDRWNPADIWFTRGPLSNISEVLESKPESCKEFTALMNDLYRVGKVVGISLKKLDSDEASAERRNPKTIKISNVELKGLGEDTKSFKINFTEEGVDWNLVIRAGNGWNLRGAVEKAQNASHFDGGCSQAIIEYAIQHCFGITDLSPYQPETFRETVLELQENFILDHQSLFTEEEVLIAEANRGGLFPVKEIEYPKELVSEGKLDPRGLACRYAIKNIYDLLNKVSVQDREHFVRTVVEFCWSIRPQSAVHYKVH